MLFIASLKKRASSLFQFLSRLFCFFNAWLGETEPISPPKQCPAFTDIKIKKPDIDKMPSLIILNERPLGFPDLMANMQKSSLRYPAWRPKYKIAHMSKNIKTSFTYSPLSLANRLSVQWLIRDNHFSSVRDNALKGDFNHKRDGMNKVPRPV